MPGGPNATSVLESPLFSRGAGGRRRPREGVLQGQFELHRFDRFVDQGVAVAGAALFQVGAAVKLSYI